MASTRDAALFSLMFFAAARFDDIREMKIGHLRFKVCVAEHERDPLSTVKLLKRRVIMRG